MRAIQTTYEPYNKLYMLKFTLEFAVGMVL